MTQPARYIIGIDLGTTNCSLAYVDTSLGDDAQVEVFAIPQVTNAGEVQPEPQLPSFLYLPGDGEVAEGALALPWDEAREFSVGRFARKRGAELPQRLVSSAKSWLCHEGIDRRSNVLPWNGPDEPGELSPVEASARYLTHLIEAWDREVGQDEAALVDQDVYLTVPASFDAVARELTVEAARAAGIEKLTLLEEPQAAFYAWLAASEMSGDDTPGWRDQLSVGDLVLVCDVGGGTTDFTLIKVEDDGEGSIQLERVAVGDHILLGGDNMDLALGMTAEARLRKAGHRLDVTQQRALIYAAREAKEQLFADPELEQVEVSVLGRGRGVVAGTLTEAITRKDLQKVLLDGFFPACPPNQVPQGGRRGGLQQLGLPFAQDPAISHHMAHFLWRQEEATPTALLFNGGVMKAKTLRARVGDLITTWVHGRGDGKPRILDAPDFDLAVASGAAYYGMARRGRGVRIRAGSARSYYIGIEEARPAVPGFAPPVNPLCVVPFGMEEGSDAQIADQTLGLVVGQPVEFRFFGSTTRKEDTPGLLIDDDPDWEDAIDELAPVSAELPPGEDMTEGTLVPVTLEARLSEIGTLELWCHAREGEGRWRLEFDIRN